MDRFTDWDFHLHNMILHGVHVPGEGEHYADVRSRLVRRFRRFTFDFLGCRYDTIYRGAADSPYRHEAGRLLYRGHAIALPFERIVDSREEWGSERNWWIKSIPTMPELYDLRLNPINSCANLRHASGGHAQLRGCVFCQRAYDAPRRPEHRRVVSVAGMMTDILDQLGDDVFAKVSKVMLVTGDVRNEPAMLDLAEEIHGEWLAPRGFGGVFSAVSTLVRSDEGLQRLAAVDPTIFEFPLECFSRRGEVLGASKGIGMDLVTDLLARAKRHFRYTRINYLVGLDSLADARAGFARLSGAGLVDDIIPNIFVPPTESAMRYRVPESFDMAYLYAMRAMLEGFGFRPHRISATKDLYSHFAKQDQADEFSPCLPPAQAVADRGTPCPES